MHSHLAHLMCMLCRTLLNTPAIVPALPCNGNGLHAPPETCTAIICCKQPAPSAHFQPCCRHVVATSLPLGHIVRRCDPHHMASGQIIMRLATAGIIAETTCTCHATVGLQLPCAHARSGCSWCAQPELVTCAVRCTRATPKTAPSAAVLQDLPGCPRTHATRTSSSAAHMRRWLKQRTATCG